ncbi:hypothetical protein [Saccharothrix hoggarensis]|uniref:Uncharacterized protein n=1 Tax=Saccharothrix hoggarensis TaxID=913853 RepID=A0ABW3QDK3_9PSEU
MSPNDTADLADLDDGELRARIAPLGLVRLLDSEDDEIAALRDAIHLREPLLKSTYDKATDRPGSSFATIHRFAYLELVDEWLRPAAYERWPGSVADNYLVENTGAWLNLAGWGVFELEPLPYRYRDAARDSWSAAAVRAVARLYNEGDYQTRTDLGVAVADASDGQWSITVYNPTRQRTLAGPESFVWVADETPNDRHLTNVLPEDWVVDGESWVELGRLVMVVRRDPSVLTDA